MIRCCYLFALMHIFFKISHSHDAFHAECPAAHKAHLAIEKGLPHHKHLDIRGVTLHSIYIHTDILSSAIKYNHHHQLQLQF